MTKPTTRFAVPAFQRGITLIEILVAVVVLSIGLLGLAGLQLMGMQVNQGSIYRWQATMLAEDLADRMRADRAGAIAGTYSGNYGGGTAPTAASPATQSAMNDWAARLATLPGSTATVSPVVAVVTGPNAYSATITVNWVDARANAGVGVAPANTAAFTPGQFILPTEF